MFLVSCAHTWRFPSSRDGLGCPRRASSARFRVPRMVIPALPARKKYEKKKSGRTPWSALPSFHVVTVACWLLRNDAQVMFTRHVPLTCGVRGLIGVYTVLPSSTHWDPRGLLYVAIHPRVFHDNPRPTMFSTLVTGLWMEGTSPRAPVVRSWFLRRLYSVAVPQK